MSRRLARFLPVAFLVLLVALAATNAVRVARDSAPPTIAGTRPAAVPPVDSLTMEQALETARARAAQWSPRATLTHASLQVDWPLGDQAPGPAQFPPGGWARFVFADPDADAILQLVVERYSGAILSESIDPWPGSGGRTVPAGTAAVSSRDAVLIAETAAGQAFRLACPATRHRLDVTVSASTGSVVPDDGRTATTVPAATPSVGVAATPTGQIARDQATWLVSYRDDRYAGSNALEVEIGAESGALLAIRDRSVPCG